MGYGPPPPGEILNGLDLHSGCGGLALALAPWVRPLAYVEANSTSQALLCSRMVGGDLPLGPIWDDLRTLDGRFFGDAIDIITATVTVGIERHQGVEGEHADVLFEVCRLADETRTDFVFIAANRAPAPRRLERFVRALADRGLDSRWDSLSTRQINAPYDQRAFFLLAARPFDGKEWFSAAPLEEPRPASIDWQDSRYWRAVPRLPRVVEGLPLQMGRNRALRDGVVPLLARAAFKMLIGIEATPLPEQHSGPGARNYQSRKAVKDQ